MGDEVNESCSLYNKCVWKIYIQRFAEKFDKIMKQYCVVVVNSEGIVWYTAALTEDAEVAEWGSPYCESYDL